MVIVLCGCAAQNDHHKSFVYTIKTIRIFGNFYHRLPSNLYRPRLDGRPNPCPGPEYQTISERQITMFTRFTSHKLALGFLALLILILAACTPALPIPQTGSQPTQPAVTEAPPVVFAGLDAEDILLQLTYEPGFVLPEYRFAFGRTPHFTLLADGRAIYVDENQDYKVLLAQLTQAETAALLQQVRDMGFAQLESHTDMCGKLVDGSEPCIADASTSIMRVRMEDGSLR